MRVLVVADSPLVRAGLESILAREPDVTLVGGAGSGNGETTIAEQVEEHDPDVVLLELGPHDDPSVPAALLLGAAPDATPDGARPALLLIAAEPGPALIEAALRAGARAVLPREASGEEIVAAARAAAAGLATVPAGFLPALLGPARPARAPSARGGEGELTPRELDVLRLLAEGLVNKQIAARLGLSDHTVKFHVGSIFQKLGASTRTEAVTIGLRRGLLFF